MMMKNKIAIIPMLLVLGACSTLPPTYLKVGTGYKLNETKVFDEGEQVNDPITARFELGVGVSESITIGYAHRSQWRRGYPVDGRGEYNVDEVFIDYTIKLN